MSQPTRPSTTSTPPTRTPGDDAPDIAQVGMGSGKTEAMLSAADRNARALSAKAPRYQRIAADLRARIESGDLAPGEAIPSETAMIEEFGVSRITIRNAIKLLRASGLVTTEQGRPTRVRDNINDPGNALEFDPTITRTADTQHPGFRTWDSHDWSAVEPDSHYRATAAQHTAALALPAAEPVFILERHLQHTSGVQATHRLFIPFATAAQIPALTENPFRPPAELYQILATAGHDLHWTDRTAALMPTPDDAATLTIPDGVPLFLHTRITHGNEDRPLILEETRLPADRITMTSQQATPAQ